MPVKLLRGALRLSLAAAVSSTWSSPAGATPQWNVGLETGACRDAVKWGFCNAVHGDVLMLRSSPHEFGLGPSLRLGTARFADLRLDLGVSALIPIFESFPLILEAGPSLRNFAHPGAFAGAFFGLRSFNYYSHYEMTGGLNFLFERSFGSDASSTYWITARIDSAWIAMPFIFAYNALK